MAERESQQIFTPWATKGCPSTNRNFAIVLDEWVKQREEERRRRPAGRRGHALVWKVLAPIAIAFALYRIWQLLTGRW